MPVRVDDAVRVSVGDCVSTGDEVGTGVAVFAPLLEEDAPVLFEAAPVTVGGGVDVDDDVSVGA